MRNLGDLEGLVLGVAEVMYSYFISPLNGGEWRYHVHPYNREPPVQDISKKERKRHPVFDGCWTKRFAFMHLPEFSSIWCLAGGMQESQPLTFCDTILILLISFCRRVPFEFIRRKEDDRASAKASHRATLYSFTYEERSVRALQHLG